MKILFDHQIFEHQRFGGVSRMHFEIISQLDATEWELPILYSDNAYLKSMPDYNSGLLSIPIKKNYSEQFLWGSKFKGKRILYELKKKLFPEPQGIDVSAINKSLVIQQLKKGDFDIFHPTYYDDYFLEFIGDKPFVLTVYDLIHQIFPEYFMYNTMDKSKTLIQRASRIAAISHSTKKDLVNIFGVDERKVIVTQLSNSLTEKNAKSKTILIESLPAKYFLFVGNRTEYKNFLFFIRMFAVIAENEKDLHVICTGPAFDKNEQYYFNRLCILSKLHHISASDDELAALYTNALALIFPSQYEGFGLPVLEAFSCGCPVLAAANSSLLEIGGDAVIYFQAKEPSSMIAAIRSVLYDETLRQDKIQKGYVQLKKFSWQKTAEETLKIYQDILQENNTQ